MNNLALEIALEIYLFSMGLQLNWYKPLNWFKILNLFNRSMETAVLQFKFDFAK